MNEVARKFIEDNADLINKRDIKSIKTISNKVYDVYSEIDKAIIIKIFLNFGIDLSDKYPMGVIGGNKFKFSISIDDLQSDTEIYDANKARDFEIACKALKDPYEIVTDWDIPEEIAEYPLTFSVNVLKEFERLDVDVSKIKSIFNGDYRHSKANEIAEAFYDAYRHTMQDVYADTLQRIATKSIVDLIPSQFHPDLDVNNTSLVFEGDFKEISDYYSKELTPYMDDNLDQIFFSDCLLNFIGDKFSFDDRSFDYLDVDESLFMDYLDEELSSI